MQSALLSALGIFLLSLCSSRPASAQWNPKLAPLPQTFLQKQSATTKSQELPKDVGAQALPSPGQLANRARLLPDSVNHERPLERMQFFGQSFTAANACGHLKVFPAPPMDSAMVMEAPQNVDTNMPKLQGLQACPQDLPQELLTFRRAPSHPGDKPNLVIPKPASETPQPK